MRIIYFILLISAMLPLSLFAQNETADSVAGRRLHGDANLNTLTRPDSIKSQGYSISSATDLNPAFDDLFFSYRLARPLDLQVPKLSFIPGQTMLFHWNSGAIVASGGVRPFPGMMQIESGAVGIYQNAGNFTFHVGGLANKYGYFRGLHTQYGIEGSISYQFSPKLSIKAFGEHYSGRPPSMANGMPMPPSMIGYYGRSTFGGYIDYQINERWGVQTGVQTVQQIGTNRYEAEPIVTPYYRINKKVAIGLPIGQILYHILKN